MICHLFALNCPRAFPTAQDREGKLKRLIRRTSRNISLSVSDLSFQRMNNKASETMVFFLLAFITGLVGAGNINVYQNDLFTYYFRFERLSAG